MAETALSGLRRRARSYGWQRIGCAHGAKKSVGWGQIWTGRWPGDVEVEEGLASDLNDLARRAARGLLHWNGQRWAEAGVQEPRPRRSRTMTKAETASRRSPDGYVVLCYDDDGPSYYVCRMDGRGRFVGYGRYFTAYRTYADAKGGVRRHRTETGAWMFYRIKAVRWGHR